MKPLTGYHTLEDRGNYEKVERNGPVKCTGSRAWLGDGYYFWDTDRHWADRWGELNYARNGYYIFSASILRDDTMYDLYGTVEHRMEFRSIIEAFIKAKGISPEETSVRQMLDYISQNATEFPYKSIRAFDIPKHQKRSSLVVQFLPAGKNRKEALIQYEERVQICVRSKECMVPDSFSLIYPRS